MFAWPLNLLSPGLGPGVNLSSPQGRPTHGRGGAALVFQHKRTTTYPPHTHTPLPQLRPVGKTTKLEVVEGRRGQEGAGGWVQTETPSPRPAPSKISTSNQALTFTEWGS